MDDPSAITTEEVSEALGGLEISEQDNVSKVLSAVVEGSCEVGTTYYSDIYGFEDQLDILQTVGYDLTGNVIYPIARVVNDEADDAQNAAADDFIKFVLSDNAKKVFESYYFDYKCRIKDFVHSNACVTIEAEAARNESFGQPPFTKRSVKI